MKISYDHRADAMTIELTDKLAIYTKHLTPDILYDLDEDDQVVRIEVLNVRKQDIDPFTLTTVHFSSEHEAQRPDPEVIRANRQAIMEARQRKREKQTQATSHE